jgi:hypothetical protein
MLQGAGMGQQAVSEASRDKYNQFRMMSEGQKMVDSRKAQQQAGRDQQELQALFAGGGVPDVAPLANGQGPTVANAAAQAPGSPKGDQYRKAAEWFAARGRTEDAKRAMDMANSFDEEFSQTPQVGLSGGRAVNALIGKKGTVKVLPDFAPTPKFREVNDGKTTRILNEYMIPETGANIAMQTTPGQDQTHGLELQKFRYQQGRDAAAAAAAAQGPGEVKPQALHADERKQLQEFTGNLENVNTLRSSFKDEYAGRGAAGALDVSAANTFGSWASRETQDLGKWWANYERMVNLPERFALFGASLTQGEKQAWDSARLVRPGADPKDVKEALTTMETIAKRKLGGLRESLIADRRQPAAIDAIVNRSAADAPSGGPKPGEVRRGFRFKGGDPSQKSNWEPV